MFKELLNYIFNLFCFESRTDYWTWIVDNPDISWDIV